MAGNIKGITIEFRGDTTKLDKALKDVDERTAKIDKELKKVKADLKFNPNSIELWRQKQTLLTQKVKETKDRLDALKNAQEQVKTGKIKMTAEEYRNLQREIIETRSKLNTFKTQLSEVGSASLKALSNQLKEVGKAASDAGDEITKKVSAPLAALGAASTKVGLDFDAAISQIAATMGTTTDQIEELRDFALEMGSTTAFSATQAAEALNYMALAGYNVEESMDMLPTVLNLAAAGNMELAKASDMVTDAQTALGLSFDDTKVLVDQMAKTASSSNTSVEQLGDAILTVGGTARNMNGGIEELNAVLGALADNGIKGSEGGTALRNMLLKLADPTSKTADALDKLGISAYDSNGHLKDLRDLFPEIAAGLNTLSDAEKNDILGDMFNVRDISKANALLNTSVERWEELSGAIQDAGGSAEKMASTQLDNLKGDLTLLVSALEGAAIAISDVLSPWIRKLADFLTKLVDKFNQLDPKTKQIIVTIAAVVAAIGPMLSIIGRLITGIGLVVGWVSKAIGVIKLIAGGLTFLSSPITLIIAGIAALAAGLIYAYNHSEKFRAVVNSVFTFVKGLVQTVINNIIERFNALKEGIASVISFLQGVVQTVKNIIQKIKDAIKLPHFSLTGSFSLMPPSVPKLAVDWYAKGGIFNAPSLIGVGEAGSEAVVPLDKLWDQMAKMNGGGVVVNVYGSDNMSVAELAAEVERRLIQAQKRRTNAWA